MADVFVKINFLQRISLMDSSVKVSSMLLSGDKRCNSEVFYVSHTDHYLLYLYMLYIQDIVFSKKQTNKQKMFGLFCIEILLS